MNYVAVNISNYGRPFQAIKVHIFDETGEIRLLDIIRMIVSSIPPRNYFFQYIGERAVQLSNDSILTTDTLYYLSASSVYGIKCTCKNPLQKLPLPIEIRRYIKHFLIPGT